MFTYLQIILDCKTWPQRNEQLMNFGHVENEASKLHLCHSCKIGGVMFKLDNLKVKIYLVSKNVEEFLNIWRKVFPF